MELLPLFRRCGTGPTEGTMRRIQPIGRQDWLRGQDFNTGLRFQRFTASKPQGMLHDLRISFLLSAFGVKTLDNSKVHTNGLDCKLQYTASATYG
jgi:hypothetical protein